jgi:membrane peptidoglycan carboxypeptidase
VKNVFLSRKKTIARKLDETLLVWLIEHNRLVSKNRLFEVYLNIIEWAPGVYGVGEAAPYYFSKTPAELSLSESIYLSSIIPKPKAFRYSFDGSGNLKPYLAGYYRLLTNIMLRRNLIDSTDTTGLSPNVILTGPARSKLVLTDTLASDSLLIDEEDAPALIQEQEPQFP